MAALFSAAIPPYEAFAQLDTGTHNGGVQLLAMTPDGRTLLSAGETTVRVWDLAGRCLKRLLLGRVDGASGGATGDRASSGKVRNLAVSPDGRWVAVVRPWWQGSPSDAGADRVPATSVTSVDDGVDGSGDDDDFSLELATAIASDRIVDAGLVDDLGWIAELQVFELATGNLRARTAFPGTLMDVGFSPDGRWLVLASNRRIAPRRRARHAPQGGAHRQAELLVLDAAALLRKRLQPMPEPVWRQTLGPVVDGETLPVRLRFVPPAAQPPGPYARHPPGRGPGTGKSAPHALVVAVSDGVNHDGHLFWLTLSAAQGLAVTRTVRTGRPLWVRSLAASATTAAVAALPGRGSRSARGQVLWYRHDDHGSGQVDTEAPPVSLAFSADGRRFAAGLRADLLQGQEPPHGTQTVQVGVYELSPGSAPGLAPVLASSYFGHDASVHGLTFVDDSTVASAGGDSQAIHVWRPARRVAELDFAFRGIGRTMVMPGVTRDERVRFGTVPARLLPPGCAIRQQTFDLRRLSLSTTTASHIRPNDNVSRKWLVGDLDDMVLPLWFVGDGQPPPPGCWPARQPDLTLFVGADGQWVIWTASGYYACASPEAARCIGYRVNRGVGQEAQLIPSDRFKAFYRPDLVRAVVRHGTEARARAAGAVIAALDVVHALPPIVELREGGIHRHGDLAGFSFTIECASRRALPTRFSLLRNDRVVWVNQAPPQRRRQRCVVPPLPLVPGVNRFSFHAENENARSVPVVIELEGSTVEPDTVGRAAASSQAPGNLYLLSVGVGRFQDERNRPLHFAASDAVAVHDAFALGRIAHLGHAASAPGRKGRRDNGGNQAFGQVVSELLTDEQATKAAILGALDRMTDEILARHAATGAERDVLFVFFSGHGMRVSRKSRPEQPPTLFFVNHDLVASFDEVFTTGLSILDLGERVTAVPAEVVLVFDACHAGLAGAEVMQVLDPAELAHRVQAIYERGMYLMGAARASELAQESNAQRGGVLTLSMLRALEAARPGHGRLRASPGLDVLMAELVSGVQRLLPEVSASAGVPAQTPVCRVFGELTPLTILKTGQPMRRPHG